MAILYLSLLPTELKAQLTHPDLQSGKKSVRTVLIMPPRASVVKSGVKGSEALVEESRVLESTLAAWAAGDLAVVGCTILQNSLTDENLSQTPDLKYALSDLQARFDKAMEEVARKPKDMRNGRYTMGDDVANFSAGAASDALVFVRGKESIYTGGKKILGALAGVYVPSAAVQMRIALVDAQSGAILYIDSGPPGIVQVNLEKAFKKFGRTKTRK
jgi:hypothetical protein